MTSSTAAGVSSLSQSYVRFHTSSAKLHGGKYRTAQNRARMFRRSASSERRIRSDSGERQSCARSARSSLYQDGVAQKLPDFKSEKGQNIKELLTFLRMMNYPAIDALTPKMMQCPPCKMFVDIFKFMVTHIMPSYDIPTKHEEAIPTIMKCLGYPHTLKKSTLVSIAPHTWPLLLHALIWLSRGIQEAIDFQPTQPAIVSMAMEALTNPNEAEDIDERLRESMMSDIVSAVDRLRQQHDEQLKKLESIKNEPVGDVEQMKEQIAAMKKTVESLTEFCAKSDAYINTSSQQLEAKQKETQRLQALLAEKQAICAEHKRQFDNQEMSVDELSQFKAQQTDLEKQMENISVQGAELDSDIWDAEIKKTQHLQEVDSMCRKFNQEVYSVMGEEIANDLHLKAGVGKVSEKHGQIVQPYLVKTKSMLAADEAVEESRAALKDLTEKVCQADRAYEELERKCRSQQESYRKAISSLKQKVEKAMADNKSTSFAVQSAMVELEEKEAELRQSEQSWEDLKVKAKAKIEYYKAEEERQTKDVDEAIDLLETASVAELKKLEELHKTVNDMTKQTDNHQHSLENLDMLMSVYDKLVH